MLARDPGSVWDPITDIIGSIRHDRPWIGIALIMAVCAHVSVGFGLRRMFVAKPSGAPAMPIEVVDIDIPRAPPPSPEPPTAPQPEQPKLSKGDQAPDVGRSIGAARDRAPPTPAQAGAVLSKREEPNEPVDLTNGFVTGSASAYVGGTTSPKGTNPNAVRGTVSPSASGAASGASNGSPPTSPGPDRSRPARVAGGFEWQCPFPPEADGESIDHAIVTIRVHVDVSGEMERVDIVRDPGHGFAREAQQCARRKAWILALDRDGEPLKGTVLIIVRFER